MNYKTLSYGVCLIWISCLCATFSFSQQRAGFVFPEPAMEFTVMFPTIPKIENVYANDGTGKSAEVTLSDCFLRAELLTMNSEQATNASRLTDEQLAGIALAYGNANGLSNATVKTGSNDLGKFARLRGYKTVANVPATFETMFIYGRKEAITLTVGGKSSSFPQKAITDFFNSVKTAVKSVTPKKIDIAITGTQIVLNKTPIKLPAERNALFEILGQPDRRSDKLNTIYTWDGLGLIAYERKNQAKVHQLSVVVNNSDMNYEFWSRASFSGVLTIDGAILTRNSTTDSINKTKKGSPFVKVPGLPFITELVHSDLTISIGRALTYEYSEFGKIVEISLEAK